MIKTHQYLQYSAKKSSQIFQKSKKHFNFEKLKNHKKYYFKNTPQIRVLGQRGVSA